MNWDQIQGGSKQAAGVAKVDAEKQIGAWQRKATDAWFAKK